MRKSNEALVMEINSVPMIIAQYRDISRFYRHDFI
jgi:hypothetical protein